MKRTALLLVLAALGAPLLQAQTNAMETPVFPLIKADAFLVPEGSYLAGEQWVVARTIRLEGDARDDLFLFAGASRLGFGAQDSGRIDIRGTVSGDLWAAGQTIDLSGSIEQHVRAAGQMVRINGPVRGNALVAATTVSLETNALVQGAARLFADYFILRGVVDGDLVVQANKVVLDGVVNGSARIRANSIAVLSQARIAGSLTCETASKVAPDGRAVIQGALVTRPPRSESERSLVSVLATFISFIGAVLTGMFFFLFSPRMVVRSVLWMESYPWRTLLVGLAAFILAPVLSLFMFFSLLGIPLSLVAGALYAVGLYLGRFIAALSLARLLTGIRRRQPMPLPSPHLMLLGLVLFYAASFLPEFLADAIWFWFTISGMGAMVLAARGAPIPLLPFPPPMPNRNTDSTTP